MPDRRARSFVRELPDAYWFATVRDAFAFAMLPEMPKAIAAIYVNDMAQARNWGQPEPGTWVEAHQAFHVIGSDRRSGTQTGEAIPLHEHSAERGFAEANSGRIVRFADMPRDNILTLSGESR
jgi:copper chaperone NosL